MSQISVNDLTFCYEGSFDNIFESVSFSIDTYWKLGFIGRNGKGKTTFLDILLGKYEYRGSISSQTVFDYFPYRITDEQLKQCATEFLEELKPGCEEWRVMCELGKLNCDAELLYRPFESLSHGQRTKVLLAVLFSGENDFLLIDEPTNHLDQESRELVKGYLQGKKGYILVSHDRDILDACVDHVLVLNRMTIEVQSGNFSSWWENKRRQDSFAIAENEKHTREIAALKRAADQSLRWADKNESTKIGFDPVKEHDRCLSTRAYIGAKTKKIQSRVTQYERRMDREIQEKQGLLQDLEEPDVLRMQSRLFHKERLITCRGLSVRYKGSSVDVLKDCSFELMQGERVFLHGENGCGKSTLIKAILTQAAAGASGIAAAHNRGMADAWGFPADEGLVITSGEIRVASNLIISYVNQDTSFLKGDAKGYCRHNGLDESLFFAQLRQLGMERVQFSKRLEDFSEGQKKKVLIASSLVKPANVYIWDEPLNYIDVFSRMQLEELLLKYEPTMILVDHDVRFQEGIATSVMEM